MTNMQDIKKKSDAELTDLVGVRARRCDKNASKINSVVKPALLKTQNLKSPVLLPS